MMKSFNFFLLWIFGFFALLAFDLIVEAFIFAIEEVEAFVQKAANLGEE